MLVFDIPFLIPPFEIDLVEVNAMSGIENRVRGRPRNHFSLPPYSPSLALMPVRKREGSFMTKPDEGCLHGIERKLLGMNLCVFYYERARTTVVARRMCMRLSLLILLPLPDSKTQTRLRVTIVTMSIHIVLYILDCIYWSSCSRGTVIFCN